MVELGKVLDDWCHAINKNNVEKSVFLSREARDRCGNKPLHDTDRRFFDLLNQQYMAMIGQAEKCLNQSETVCEDDRFTYFSRFRSARKLFEERKYQEALEMYQQAEGKLYALGDDILRGEHFLRVGYVLYRKGKYEEAKNELRRAESIFVEKGFLKKVIDCGIIFGAIASECHNNEKAEQIYSELLVKAEKSPLDKSYIYKVTGQHFFRKGDFEASKKMYRLAIADKEFEQSEAAARAYIELSEVSYALDESDAEANILRDRGRELAEHYQDKEYMLRAHILSCQYEMHDQEEIWRSVCKLADHGLDFAAKDVAVSLSMFYKKRNQEMLAIKYEELVNCDDVASFIKGRGITQ